MQVETYEVEEINSSEAAIMAADSESIELTEKLGLEGQKLLVQAKTETRLPYRVLTREETAIFGTCFPQQTNVEQYADGIIPLRVLQVIAHCNEQQFFQKLIVWHSTSGQAADPVLIGQRSVRLPGQSWDTTQQFLLARWGTALESVDHLRAKARSILIARWTKQLQSIAQQAQSGLAIVESTVDEMLNGGEHKSNPYYSWT